MGNYRKIESALKGQVTAAYSRKNVIAGYILGVITVLKNAIHYSGYVGEHTVNFTEAYVINLSDKGTAMILIIGCIIAMSDAPFIHAGSFSLIHRVGRKQWYIAMWLYMMILCVFYYLSCILTSILPFIWKGYVENTWSQTMLRILKGQADVMQGYSLSPPCSNIFLLSPCETLVHSFLCIVLYTLCLSSVLLVFNMKLNKEAFGTIATGCVHILSMLMCFQWLGGIDLSKWSLFRNAVFPVFYAPQSVSLMFTYSYFIVVLYLMYIVGEHLLPHTNFVLNIGAHNV